MFQETWDQVTTALDFSVGKTNIATYETPCPLVKYPLQFGRRNQYETMGRIRRKIQKYQAPIINITISNTFLSETVIPMAQAHAAYKGKQVHAAIAWGSCESCQSKRLAKSWSRKWLAMRYWHKHFDPVRLYPSRWTLRHITHGLSLVRQTNCLNTAWQLMRIPICVSDGTGRMHT